MDDERYVCFDNSYTYKSGMNNDPLKWHYVTKTQNWWRWESSSKYLVLPNSSSGVLRSSHGWGPDSWRRWKHARGMPVTSLLKLLYPKWFPSEDKISQVL